MTLAYVDMPAVIQVQVYFELESALGIHLRNDWQCVELPGAKNPFDLWRMCVLENVGGFF